MNTERKENTPRRKLGDKTMLNKVSEVISHEDVLSYNYQGFVNYDARTGCYFTVLGRGTYRILNSFQEWVHFSDVATGETFNASYEKLREVKAIYCNPVNFTNPL